MENTLAEDQVSTIAHMPDKKRGRPKVPEPKALSASVKMTASHYRQLRALADRTYGRSVSTEILIAIEERLGRYKLWPPPA
jgi:hypothetical protein